MTPIAKFIAVAGLAGLAACGGEKTPGENVAEQAGAVAENMEQQADIIEERADEVRNEAAEQAMENQAEAIENRADTVRDTGKKQGEALDEAQGR